VLTFNRVVELLDATYGALAHPIRREVLDTLRTGPLRVTDLARRFPVSLAAVSKHIRVLEEARLVTRQTRGREHYLSLRPDPLAEAHAWTGAYRDFWDARLDQLEAHLRNER
jgi:DNA-binding transcriptional ArsR family regulator